MLRETSPMICYSSSALFINFLITCISFERGSVRMLRNSDRKTSHAAIEEEAQREAGGIMQRSSRARAEGKLGNL